MKAIHAPGLAAEYWDRDDVAEKGSFEVTADIIDHQRYFHFICPGCSTLAKLTLRPVVDGSPQSWEWNGSTEAPTLQPSINHNGCWHGWLTDGAFIGC
jgi:hypothetical protein